LLLFVEVYPVVSSLSKLPATALYLYLSFGPYREMDFDFSAILVEEQPESSAQYWIYSFSLIV
jgi:hypothetical protein